MQIAWGLSVKICKAAVDCPAIDAKGLFTNNLDKIALRFGSDLVVATSAKPQA